MNRRHFNAALAGVLFGPARSAAAQNRVPQIVYLWLGPVGSDRATRSGLEAGLREIGYREGRGILVDYRYADGSETRLAELAAAAVAQRPDLIVAPGSVATGSLVKLTKTVPIVSVSGDPVGSGFVASLAHPGGNITGLTVQVGPELAEKWLELILEIVPGARRIALLVNAPNAVWPAELSRMRAAADRLSRPVAIDEYAIRAAADLPSAVARIVGAKPDALVVDNDPLLIAKSADIVARAGALPTISGNREFAAAGGLLAYGASIFDIYRRAATYIDRILKGARPADLPVEQPTKFEMLINLKTAKALGLAVPQSLLARVDEVIE